jgi:hypothetical protein
MSILVSIGSHSIAMTPSASPNSLTPASANDTLEMAQNPVEIPKLPIESGDESLPTPSNSLPHHDEEHDPGKIEILFSLILWNLSNFQLYRKKLGTPENTY